MTPLRPQTDPAHADRAWAGYHPRAAGPALALAALVSLVVWTGHWYLDDLSTLADRLGGLAMFALAWCVWPGLATVFLYRTVTYTYRLTDRALFVDFGFWHAPTPPVWLHEVTGVVARRGWLGTGWVEVRAGARAVRLIGVRGPYALAEAIRVAVAARRQLIH
ncbi:MAG: hypothetical protein FJ304_07720 [Planctomycetes bacterium]|nr:hypothetical protein [Planctomycetota bacterium]